MYRAPLVGARVCPWAGRLAVTAALLTAGCADQPTALTDGLIIRATTASPQSSGISGAIGVDPAVVTAGNPTTVTYLIRNDGAGTVPDVPIVIRLVDPETGETLATLADVATIPAGGAYVNFKLLPTAGLNPKTYLVILEVILEGPLQLSTTTLTVLLTEVNETPVADAGPDPIAECTAQFGAAVTLDGSASFDGDGDIVAYDWMIGGTVIATGVNPTVTLPLGDHTITLRVLDDDGADAVDDVLVNVVDTTRPEISMLVSPTRLWPPNHQMVKVASGISATDICDHAPDLAVLVTIDEAAPDRAAGHTGPDWEVTRNADGSLDVWVRAERAGSGAGRVYTITATATDRSGNRATEIATVEVPYELGRRR